MRRPVLLTLVALGLLISLIGSTGLFAALTDTASTGTNSVDSAELAASADIQLATGTFSTAGAGSVSCGDFADLLSSGFFTVSDMEADSNAVVQYFCIKNVGSQSVSLSAIADGLTDLDTGCSGDEAEYDDTCGSGLAGELAANLSVGYATVSCTAAGYSYTPVSLASNATTAAALGDLAVGATGCYRVNLFYPDSLAADAIQAAQSDTVTWRFKFIAEA